MSEMVRGEENQTSAHRPPKRAVRKRREDDRGERERDGEPHVIQRAERQVNKARAKAARSARSSACGKRGVMVACQNVAINARAKARSHPQKVVCGGRVAYRERQVQHRSSSRRCARGKERQDGGRRGVFRQVVA